MGASPRLDDADGRPRAGASRRGAADHHRRCCARRRGRRRAGGLDRRSRAARRLSRPGDVDVVLASELMEAARAVERGFVTPERTLLIASTHRVFAMTEKIALPDGREDAAALLAGCPDAARALVAFDMAALADATGSVLSAVLFGALAGSGALPFPRAAFEAAIRRGQVGVNSS